MIKKLPHENMKEFFYEVHILFFYKPNTVIFQYNQTLLI